MSSTLDTEKQHWFVQWTHGPRPLAAVKFLFALCLLAILRVTRHACQSPGNYNLSLWFFFTNADTDTRTGTLPHHTQESTRDLHKLLVACPSSGWVQKPHRAGARSLEQRESLGHPVLVQQKEYRKFQMTTSKWQKEKQRKNEKKTWIRTFHQQAIKFHRKLHCPCQRHFLLLFSFHYFCKTQRFLLQLYNRWCYFREKKRVFPLMVLRWRSISENAEFLRNSVDRYTATTVTTLSWTNLVHFCTLDITSHNQTAGDGKKCGICKRTTMSWHCLTRITTFCPKELLKHLPSLKALKPWHFNMLCHAVFTTSFITRSFHWYVY